jgi:hypothetical protein
VVARHYMSEFFKTFLRATGSTNRIYTLAMVDGKVAIWREKKAVKHHTRPCKHYLCARSEHSTQFLTLKLFATVEFIKIKCDILRSTRRWGTFRDAAPLTFGRLTCKCLTCGALISQVHMTMTERQHVERQRIPFRPLGDVNFWHIGAMELTNSKICSNIKYLKKYEFS